MRFMYVDESGDPGHSASGLYGNGGPTRHFILTGCVIDAMDWRNSLSALVDIRRQLKAQFNYPVRAELHAREIVHPKNNAAVQSIGNRKRRFEFYRLFLSQIAARLPRARIINVMLDKQTTTAQPAEWEDKLWDRLLVRLNNHLNYDCGGDLAMVFADETNERRLRTQMRRMRVFYHVPSRFGGTRTMPCEQVVEDPVIRDSQHSYFIQIADMVCHALYHKEYPKGSFKKYGADRLFTCVDPVLLKAAAKHDPLGIVRI